MTATKTKGPNSILASAKILTGSRIDDPKTEGWQVKMWHYYENIGEFRRGVDWVATGCSKIPLIAAKRDQAGDEPEPITEGNAATLVAQLGGGMGGHKELIEEMVRHLLVVGITYLVGTEQGQLWRVCSSEEIRRSSASGSTYDVLEEVGLWVGLPPDSIVVRVHTPDPRRHFEPTCIARSAMPVMREIELITEHIQSTMINRLAGAGLLVLPSEVTFPASDKAKESGQDPFVFDLIETMSTAIKSASAAARVVPMVIQVPGDFVDKVKHITFTTPFDDRTMEQRQEAVGRLATMLYIETKVLTGGEDLNHWGLWHVDEQTLTMHIQPMMGAICADITLGYFLPALGAISETGIPVVDSPIVWYDSSILQVRPDKSDDTVLAYDRGEASGKALRRETGLSEDDKPTDEELRDWALRKAVNSGDKDLMIAALQVLGAGIEVPEPEAIEAEEVPNQEELPPGQTPSQGPPVDPSEPPTPAVGVRAGLLDACDGLVWRALERAGRRMQQVAKVRGKLPYPATQVHCHIRALELENLQDGYLLEGAWDRVPEVARRFGVERLALAAALDNFTNGLIANQVEYSYDLLAEALRDGSWLNQQTVAA